MRRSAVQDNRIADGLGLARRFHSTGIGFFHGGERLLAIRYSSSGTSRSLFYSNSYRAMKELYPDHPRLADFPEDARAVVSEPLSSLGGLWVEVPENTVLEISGGEVHPFPFEPHPP